jgi:putative toxin-antitoxin system antitoxin component (TIGR02293 family)
LQLPIENFSSRLARIQALALETFGDEEKARSWMSKSLRQLGRRTPLQMLDTELDAREVETILGRIAHGIAA